MSSFKDLWKTFLTTSSTDKLSDDIIIEIRKKLFRMELSLRMKEGIRSADYPKRLTFLFNKTDEQILNHCIKNGIHPGRLCLKSRNILKRLINPIMNGNHYPLERSFKHNYYICDLKLELMIEMYGNGNRHYRMYLPIRNGSITKDNLQKYFKKNNLTGWENFTYEEYVSFLMENEDLIDINNINYSI
tara:strand:+ start:125 stop:688 length:564 start_codon:yes stop_codon:yes gene_type:complete